MTPEQEKNIARGFSSDMSGAAVERRVAIVSQLRALTIELGKVKLLGPVDPTAAAEAKRRERASAENDS
jgi:hypothetical protein